MPKPKSKKRKINGAEANVEAEIETETEVLAETETEDQNYHVQEEKIEKDFSTTITNHSINPNADSPISEQTSPDDHSDLTESEILQLEQQTISNPYDYDNHLKLVTRLRESSLLSSLRLARERMSQQFPLPPYLWLEWISDERKMASDYNEQEYILNLYQKATNDYLYTQLWIDYCTFAEELLYDEDSIDLQVENNDIPTSPLARLRSIYQSAANAMLYHVTDGEKMLRQYRSFENKVLTQMLRIKLIEDQERQPDEEEEEENEGEAAIMNQIERLRKIYHSALNAPLNGIEQAYLEYSQWQAKQGQAVEASITEVYQKVKSARELRQPYEKSLLSLPVQTSPGTLTTESLSTWLQYCEFESSCSGGKKRVDGVCCVFERAVTAGFLHAEIWNTYVKYINLNGKESEKILNIYSRALRNLPFLSHLRPGLLRAMERNSRDIQEIEIEYNKTLQLTSFGDDYIQCCITMGTIYRRIFQQRQNNVESVTDKHSSLSTIISALDTIEQHCIQLLRYSDNSQLALLHPNTLISTYLFFVNIRAFVLNDPFHARQLMEQLTEIKLQQGNYIDVYNEWIKMEIRGGWLDQARKVYLIVIDKLSERNDLAVESMSYAWTCFESQCGDVQDFDVAYRRYEKAKQLASNIRSIQSQRINESVVRESQKGSKRDDVSTNKKVKRSQEASEQEEKKSNNKSSTQMNDDVQKKKTKKKEIKSTTEVEIPPNILANPNSSRLPSSNSVDAPVSSTFKPADPSTLVSGPSTLSSLPSAPSNFDASRSLHIANLPNETNKDQIISLLQPFGIVSQINLRIRPGKHPKKNGQTKNDAHIELEDSEATTNAITQLNQRTFHDHTLWVRPVKQFNTNVKNKTEKDEKMEVDEEVEPLVKSKQKSENKEKSLANIDDKRIVFLKNCPRTFDQEDIIRTKFTLCGPIERIQTAKDSNGNMKSFAFVLFKDESSATSALSLNQSKLGDNIISVVHNEPRSREDRRQKSESTVDNKAVSRKHINQPNAKIAIPTSLSLTAFLPRTAQLNKPIANTKKLRDDGHDKDNSMRVDEIEHHSSTPVIHSNEEFRKMFL